MRTIARRYARDQVKRREQGAKLEGDVARNAHHEGLESAVVRDDQILHLLAALPNRQRDVMTLVFEELDNAEIARALRILEVPGAIQRTHARKRLKRIYAQELRDGWREAGEQGGAGDQS